MPIVIEGDGSVTYFRDILERMALQEEGAEELDAVRDALFVEFARVETATIAAHAFHRREYDGRVVECRFFPLTEYQRMFGKGFPPRTVEEKQAAALRMMDFLAGTAGSGTGRLEA